MAFCPSYCGRCRECSQELERMEQRANKLRAAMAIADGFRRDRLVVVSLAERRLGIGPRTA